MHTYLHVLDAQAQLRLGLRVGSDLHVVLGLRRIMDAEVCVPSSDEVWQWRA